jgi:hypothetical protein
MVGKFIVIETDPFNPMKLSAADLNLFMKLLLELQWYAQQQSQILPKVTSFRAYIDTSMQDKVEVRNYLFSHTELIDQFIKANPAKLNKAELAIVATWKNSIHGAFIIERFLKKYSVFIDSKDRVYAVLGLKDDLSERIDKRSLPVRVQTALMPFKGQIVYDGLLGFYNLSFGSGLRSHFKALYLTAKDNNAIIQALDEANLVPTVFDTAQRTQSNQDWAPLLEELAQTAKKLRGGGGQPAINSPVFSLVRASIEFAQLATVDSPDVNKVNAKGRRLGSLLSQIEDVVDRTL